MIPLFQESLVGEPFWMVAGCILMNRASWRTAGPAHAGVRKRWPTPDELAQADPNDVEAVVRRVGFGRQRSLRLVAMASAWVARPPATAADVLELPGCGSYASDSYAIFVEGRTDVRPSDHRLREYLAEKSTMGRFLCLLPSEYALHLPHIPTEEGLMSRNVYQVRVRWHFANAEPVETIVSTEASTSALGLKLGRRSIFLDYPGACIEKAEIVYNDAEVIPSEPKETIVSDDSQTTQHVEGTAPEQAPEDENAGKRQYRPREFRPPTLGKFAFVRPGTKLADFLTLATEGTRTLDELAAAHGVDTRAANVLLRQQLAKAHGIGHRIEGDGTVKISPPRGQALGALIGEPEPRAQAVNGSFKPVKEDSKLGRNLRELLRVRHTIDSFAPVMEFGPRPAEKANVKFLLNRSLRDLHGIGHTIEEDGTVVIVPPEGKLTDDLFARVVEAADEKDAA